MSKQVLTTPTKEDSKEENKEPTTTTIAMAKKELEEEEKEIKLKYALNELKNLKVAKANARRSMTPKKDITNDTNILVDYNSAHYLAVKEELTKLTTGQSSETDEVKLEVETSTTQKDTEDNTAITVIKLKVTQKSEGEVKWETNATMLLYHSKQRIHLQGGRRNGKVTSVSLVANFLDGFNKSMLLNHQTKIQSMKEALLTMDLRRNYGGVKTRQKQNPWKGREPPLLKCELCHYKTIQKTELTRHMYSLHPDKSTSPEAAKSDSRIKRKSVQFAASNKLPKITEESSEEEDEAENAMDCIQCKYECKDETVLHEHIKYIHTIPQTFKDVIKMKDIVDVSTIALSLSKEASSEPRTIDSKDEEIKDLKLKLVNAVNMIENLHLEVTGLKVDLKNEREEKDKATEAKTETEKCYQEAAKVISQQSRKIIESNETIKVMENLKNIEQDLVSVQKKKIENNKEEENWEEVWEENEEGNMVAAETRQVGEFGWESKPQYIACKKCENFSQTKIPTGFIWKNMRKTKTSYLIVTFVILSPMIQQFT